MTRKITNLEFVRNIQPTNQCDGLHSANDAAREAFFRTETPHDPSLDTNAWGSDLTITLDFTHPALPLYKVKPSYLYQEADDTCEYRYLDNEEIPY